MVGIKCAAAAIAAVIVGAVEAQTSTAASALPTVDLGYAVHRPTLNVCLLAILILFKNYSL